GEEDFEQRCKSIRNLFFDSFNFHKITCVHCFLPILKNREINTWLIIEGLRTLHPPVDIAVSVSNFQSMEMENYLLTENTQLIDNKWGIPEPVNAELLPSEKIDLVLLPLLAFDEQGHRVGYGKGFYDRFLSKCRPDLVTIGLSLEPPIPFIEGTHEYDYKMDYAITPEKVWSFD
ncbi:5-formyltetrahydrofolate cyclo-ligase, partial [Xanthovirga aplysinae]|uniref:5-formyltetrahydrofolate cyclo-ligase n=1 Tax=Xanthovirga aplysinae TaxID=2529853 RepID=UPI0012BC6A2E